ncbi:hypothetical protein LCGC14_1492850 [marine sediment metagenome]|uniref:Uncharacterized protein n=1 Tax=marine sediment metagenome TaxID=412755 RepID=A0A0F9M803_9ZZZZ
MRDFGSPPWPLVLNIAWHGNKLWSRKAKSTMHQRFPNGLHEGWLGDAIEWWARNMK